MYSTSSGMEDVASLKEELEDVKSAVKSKARPERFDGGFFPQQ